MRGEHQGTALRHRSARAAIGGLLVVITILGFAPAAHAATTITGKLSSTNTDPGVARTVSGAVSPSSALTTVRLQRYTGGKWVDLKSVAVSAGKYSTTISFNAPGTYRLRVASPGLSIRTPSMYLRVWANTWLDSKKSVAKDDYLWKLGRINGPVKVNGTTYTHAIWRPGCGRYNSYIEYDLGRAEGRFRTTVGQSDSSPSTASVTYEVYGDNARLASVTVPFGTSKPIDISVSGVLRLRLTVSTSSTKTGCEAVFGDAQLKR